MKYIIIEDERGGEFPVFCLAPQKHAEMATAWRRDETRRVVAAGFCEFISPLAGETAWGVRVFGESDSLNLGNRGAKDEALISVMYHGTLAMAKPAERRAS